MNFETVTTLDDQTFLVTPRNAGQVVRFAGSDTVTTAGVPVRLYGTGAVELSEGWWDEVGVFAGEYSGPWVAGEAGITERVNHFKRPYPTAATPWHVGAGTGGAVTLDTIDDARFASGKARKATWTATPTSQSGLYVTTQSGQVQTQIGQTWTFSFRYAATNLPSTPSITLGGAMPPVFTTLGQGTVDHGDGTRTAWRTVQITSLGSGTGLTDPILSGWGLPPVGGILLASDGLAEQSPILRDFFSGNTGTIMVDGVQRGTQWDGTPNASTSSTIPLPAAVRYILERSTDGITWEPVPGGDLTNPATLYDFESPSYGELQYRVTAYTAENATATTITTVTADSMAFWLSGGVGFAQTCRLPLNPDVSYTTGRERVEKWWAGRERPETITGEGVRETVSVSGTTWDLIDGQGAATASPSELRSLARSAERLHLFRTPDGNRVYGQLSSITMPRKLSMKLDGGWNGYWGYSFDITEAT